MAESLHFLLIKAISLASRHSGKVMNLYFILTFPLTTLLALIVFRRFQVAYLPALVGSLLFAFTPYHFFRGEKHLFLAAYYLVPLVIMIAVRICQGWNPWSSSAEPRAGSGSPDPAHFLRLQERHANQGRLDRFHRRFADRGAARHLDLRHGARPIG